MSPHARGVTQLDLLPLSQAPRAFPLSLGGTAMAQHCLCLTVLAPRPGLAACSGWEWALGEIRSFWPLCSDLSCSVCTGGREGNGNNLLVGCSCCGASVPEGLCVDPGTFPQALGSCQGPIPQSGLGRACPWEGQQQHPAGLCSPWTGHALEFTCSAELERGEKELFPQQRSHCVTTE